MNFNDIYAYFLLAGVIFVLFSIISFDPEKHSKKHSN